MFNGETAVSGKTLGRSRQNPLARIAPPARRILVTGFGPFPGVPFNASEHLLGTLDGLALPIVPKPRLVTAALPTDWLRAAASFGDLVAKVKPDIVLHFGVSHSATGFVIETCAYNQTSARLDCAGASAPARRIRWDAPDRLSATMPAARIVQRLRQEGLPAQLSRDPGRYLCNAVFLESLLLAHRRRIGFACFAHIPALDGAENSGMARSAFGWPELRRGAGIILATLARLRFPQR